MAKRVADVLVDTLAAHGVERVYGQAVVFRNAALVFVELEMKRGRAS
jgi:hypothetical protein